MKVKFESLTPQEQRHEIGAYMNKFPYQRGLFGEAIGEHRDASLIRAAMLSGDYLRFGELADGAIREYIGCVIDRDKDWRIEE